MYKKAYWNNFILKSLKYLQSVINFTNSCEVETPYREDSRRVQTLSNPKMSVRTAINDFPEMTSLEYPNVKHVVASPTVQNSSRASSKSDQE